MEIAKDWQAGRRIYGKEAMKKLLKPQRLIVSEPVPFRLASVK